MIGIFKLVLSLAMAIVLLGGLFGLAESRSAVETAAWIGAILSGVVGIGAVFVLVAILDVLERISARMATTAVSGTERLDGLSGLKFDQRS